MSVEIGHLYMEDFVDGEDAVRRTFAAAAPWVRTAQTPQAVGCDKKSVRVSTCFLIDDYFSRFSSPAAVIPMVLAAAEREGVEIDYLARESACASANGISPATLTLGSLVTEPVPGTTGGRPPLTETGWLTNGQRSPSTARGEAMARRTPWQPPRESARRRHSIFVDVELWDERDGQRTWSCPMLAAVWQLMRLGLLRDQGRPVVTPQDWTDPRFPDSWDDLPAGHPAQAQGGGVRRLHDAFGLVTALPAGRTGGADHSQPVRLRQRHLRGSDRQGRARRDADCPPSWSTGSATCSRPREIPTPRDTGSPRSLVDLALGVGVFPQLLEPLLKVTNPRRLRCQPGPERCPAASGPR